MKSQNENSATDQTKKNQTETKRYAFAQKQGDDFSCIKLLDGEFEGVIFKYNQVKFATEPNENDQLPLKFTYDVFQNPNEVNVKCDEFRNYIGDILVELVEEQLKNGTIKFEQ